MIVSVGHGQADIEGGRRVSVEVQPAEPASMTV
jgi:hypothetical protein